MGIGSRRPTIEGTQSLVLKASLLRGLDLGTDYDYRYATLRGVEVCIIAGGQLMGRSLVHLHFTHPWSGQSVLQKVFLDATYPKFGGRRWWFICPETGRRVGALYLPKGGTCFRSRQAYGLKYQTQNLGQTERLMKKARHLHKRLGGDGCALAQSRLSLTKPKWKHWDAWEKEVGRWKEVDIKAFAALFKLDEQSYFEAARGRGGI